MGQENYPLTLVVRWTCGFCGRTVESDTVHGFGETLPDKGPAVSRSWMPPMWRMVGRRACCENHKEEVFVDGVSQWVGEPSPADRDWFKTESGWKVVG